MYDQIKKYIEKNVSARERRNKNKFIAWFLFNKYKLQDNKLDQDTLEELIVMASDCDRYWRKVLQECPDLRGKDYMDKVVIAQEKQIELGYEPGYYKNKLHDK